MFYLYRISIAIVISLLLFPARSLTAETSRFSKEFIEAAEKAKPAVVNINVYVVETRNRKTISRKVGYGSGTIISKSGYIVTNYHVLNKGNQYKIILNDGAECDVQRLSSGKYYVNDEKTDLAVIKINETEISKIDPIPIYDSDKLSEGEWVIAIGNPYGLRQSITCGIVSSKGRIDIGFADIEDFIQTDVPINPGNSGGPLINLQGKLVGINTAIRTVSGGYQGISFAIPSNIVVQVCSELIKYGRVRRGWLGFLARERRLSDSGRLVEVLSVIKDSPAEISGIKRGDIIKEIDDERISSLGELLKIIGSKPVNSVIRLNISREGELREFTLTLIEKEKHLKIHKSSKIIYSLYGIELDRNSMTGDAVISYVSPMGIAYQNGIKSGDIVAALNGVKISSVEDFIKIFIRSRSRIESLNIYRDNKLYLFELSED